MKLNPYPHYKDSTVEWLGLVPEHWRIERLKNSVTSCRNGIWGEEAQGDVHDIPCVRVADFDRQRLQVVLADPTIRNVTFKERNGRLLARNDLLLEKSGGGENQPVGCVVIYEDDQPAVCSNFVARMVIAKGFNPSFCRYVHAAAYSIRLTVGSINQTSGIQNLDQQRYFNEVAAFPSEREQQTIASFLDRETAKLDTLIAKQERLIELAQEKRQAIISNAVTKGLNPGVPMKDSGVEWLGNVPAHWDVKQIKRLSRVSRGASPRPIDDPKYFDNDGEYGWVRIADVTASGIYLEETTQKLSELGSSLSVKIDIGQLFISIAGTVGKPCISGIKCCIHDGFVYFPDLKIKPLFIYYIFEAGEAYKGLGKMGTQLNLNTDTVGSIKIGVPPDHEINQIIEFILAETKKADRVIEKSKNNIELMREHRTALISAAVTGKIDVRETA